MVTFLEGGFILFLWISISLVTIVSLIARIIAYSVWKGRSTFATGIDAPASGIFSDGTRIQITNDRRPKSSPTTPDCNRKHDFFVLHRVIYEHIHDYYRMFYLFNCLFVKWVYFLTE